MIDYLEDWEILQILDKNEQVRPTYVWLSLSDIYEEIRKNCSEVTYRMVAQKINILLKEKKIVKKSGMSLGHDDEYTITNIGKEELKKYIKEHPK